MRNIIGCRSLLLILLLLLSVSGLSAQDTTDTTRVATSTQIIRVRSGPGITHPQINRLEPDVEVEIVERNLVGNWVRVVSGERESPDYWQGWVLTGYLNLSPEFSLSNVPVNTTVRDANLAEIEDEALRTLASVPVISPISNEMFYVHVRGRLLGNLPNRITKIGDSVTADDMYLQPMRAPNYELGPYDFLETTLQFFAESAGERSVAARIGMASRVVFDPMWADNAVCEDGESPLACELRRKQPSVAFVLFGGNDLQYTSREDYTAQITQIVEETLEEGVIPVLSTFSYDPRNEYWERAVEFNLAIVEIAEEYQVPLINLWSAAMALPEYGLEGDGIHMQRSGVRYIKLDDGYDARYGVTLRNLLSLVMLDQLRVELNMDG